MAEESKSEVLAAGAEEDLDNIAVVEERCCTGRGHARLLPSQYRGTAADLSDDDGEL